MVDEDWGCQKYSPDKRLETFDDVVAYLKDRYPEKIVNIHPCNRYVDIKQGIGTPTTGYLACEGWVISSAKSDILSLDSGVTRVWFNEIETEERVVETTETIVTFQ